MLSSITGTYGGGCGVAGCEWLTQFWALGSVVDE